MKNPFSHCFKPREILRGIPDSALQSNASAVPPPPAGYPTITGTSGGSSSYNYQPPVVDPPTAYPYAAQQAEKAEAAAWEFTAGNNTNKIGQQKIGHIMVGNTSKDAPLPINLPQDGRLVFNVGGNSNEGQLQEVGGIEFGNVR